MQVTESDASQWSRRTFGSCQLGDKRRTERLVDIGARMAGHVGSTLSKSCSGDPAALLGGYRFMRNDEVSPQGIRAGGFAATAQQAQGYEVLLAVEDTTTVSYRHAGAQELGPTANVLHGKRRGYQVHSVLLVDGVGERTVGLIEQRHWSRQASEHGKKYQRKKRAYKSKESYKWEESARNTAQRLGEAMQRTIAVCDREADIYDYLSFKLQQVERFVVRATADRAVLGSELKLFEQLEQASAELCCYTVQVAQRGGRAQRQARLSLRSLGLTLQAPQGRKSQDLQLNAVLAEEIGAPAGAEPLCWVLLSTEAVDTAEAALRVVRYYECRWRIEEYHKAWKSGVGVERQRYQSPPNLERMLAVSAFLAVWLLQLREAHSAPQPTTQPEPCAMLKDDEWKVLWISTQQRKPLPSSPPPASWIFLALAKLGGFADTKRTGRPSWQAVWDGWFRFQERLIGYRASQHLMSQQL